MKIQVTGQTILFTGSQLERGNKPFDIQEGRYPTQCMLLVRILITTGIQ